MAKQAGILFITGCIDHICFYKMNGQYYARMKSSLTGKRVKTDKRFKETMRYAEMLGLASKLAAQVYKELAAAEKQKGLFRYLTGRAFGFLKEGVFKEDVLFLLRVELVKASPGNDVYPSVKNNLTDKPGEYAAGAYVRLKNIDLTGTEKMKEGRVFFSIINAEQLNAVSFNKPGVGRARPRAD